MVYPFYKVLNVSVELVPTCHQRYSHDYKRVERNLEVNLLERYVVKTAIGVGSLNSGAGAHNDSEESSYYEEYECSSYELVSDVSLDKEIDGDSHECEVDKCYEKVYRK